MVVEVRAGTDLAKIAGRHARTRGGIKSRLVRMIPDGEDVPDGEQLDITLGEGRCSAVA